MMSRAEHLQWCKDRALEYLPHDPGNALTSMISDLRKHPETADSAQLGMLGLLGHDSPERMRDFINGFH